MKFTLNAVLTKGVWLKVPASPHVSFLLDLLHVIVPQLRVLVMAWLPMKTINESRQQVEYQPKHIQLVTMPTNKRVLS